MLKSISKEMNAEEKLNRISEIQDIRNLQMCLAKFCEGITFNENYLDFVLKIQANRKQVNIFNSLKEIRNGGKK